MQTQKEKEELQESCLAGHFEFASGADHLPKQARMSKPEKE